MSERSREERAQERREVRAEAAYELWRSGRGNGDEAYSDRGYDLSWDHNGQEIARILMHEKDDRAKKRAKKSQEEEPEEEPDEEGA